MFIHASPLGPPTYQAAASASAEGVLSVWQAVPLADRPGFWARVVLAWPHNTPWPAALIAAWNHDLAEGLATSAVRHHAWVSGHAWAVLRLWDAGHGPTSKDAEAVACWTDRMLSQTRWSDDQARVLDRLLSSDDWSCSTHERLTLQRGVERWSSRAQTCLERDVALASKATTAEVRL